MVLLCEALSMGKYNELPVIRATDEFTLWLLPKIGKFPRDLRFTLGARIA